MNTQLSFQDATFQFCQVLPMLTREFFTRSTLLKGFFESAPLPFAGFMFVAGLRHQPLGFGLCLIEEGVRLGLGLVSGAPSLLVEPGRGAAHRQAADAAC